MFINNQTNVTLAPGFYPNAQSTDACIEENRMYNNTGFICYVAMKNCTGGVFDDEAKRFCGNLGTTGVYMSGSYFVRHDCN